MLFSDIRSALLGDIEVEKASDNKSSDGEDADQSGKFDFGPPLRTVYLEIRLVETEEQLFRK